MYYIAIEKGLKKLANYLTSKGHNVDLFYESAKSNSSYFDKYDVVIINNVNRNLLTLYDKIISTSIINSDLLGIHDGLSLHTAINTGILNENAIEIKEVFTNTPIIDAYTLTSEEVSDKLHNL